MKSDGIGIFGKNLFDVKIKGKKKSERNLHCRRKLEQKFEECDSMTTSTPNSDTKSSSVLASFTLEDTRKAYRNGIEKINKTLAYVKTSLDTFSQKFKVSTRRRQILEETCATPKCMTPGTFSKLVLGRTPTKLYSPFSIESPYNNTIITPK